MNPARLWVANEPLASSGDVIDVPCYNTEFVHGQHGDPCKACDDTGWVGFRLTDHVIEPNWSLGLRTKFGFPDHGWVLTGVYLVDEVNA